jgi:hypothetical protein
MYALCEHCADNRKADDDKHGPEFEKACMWFRKTPAPKVGFNLFPWKRIDHPSKLWTRLEHDLKSDNLYTRERLVEEMIALYNVFNSSEGEDF